MDSTMREMNETKDEFMVESSRVMEDETSTDQSTSAPDSSDLIVHEEGRYNSRIDPQFLSPEEDIRSDQGVRNTRM